MSTTANERRLDQIEEQLPPQAWAIRLADEVRKYPSLHDFCIANIKSGANPAHKAQDMLLQQAEAKYPGQKAAHERRAEVKRVQTEFNMMQHLVFDVNEAIRTKTEKAGMEAALKLQTLQIIILQATFRETAMATSAWIEGQKATGPSTEERRAVLAELATYRPDADTTDYPSAAEMWSESVRALAFDLACHKAAVVVLQNRYFDGHGLLAQDIEADLNGLIQTVAEAIAQHNEYLMVRGNRDERLRIAVESLTPPAKWAKSLTDHWLQDARDTAICNVLNWMGDTAGRDAYRREVAKRMIGSAE